MFLEAAQEQTRKIRWGTRGQEWHCSSMGQNIKHSHKKTMRRMGNLAEAIGICARKKNVLPRMTATQQVIHHAYMCTRTHSNSLAHCLSLSHGARSARLMPIETLPRPKQHAHSTQGLQNRSPSPKILSVELY